MLIKKETLLTLKEKFILERLRLHYQQKEDLKAAFHLLETIKIPINFSLIEKNTRITDNYQENIQDIIRAYAGKNPLKSYFLEQLLSLEENKKSLPEISFEEKKLFFKNYKNTLKELLETSKELRKEYGITFELSNIDNVLENACKNYFEQTLTTGKIENAVELFTNHPRKIQETLWIQSRDFEDKVLKYYRESEQVFPKVILFRLSEKNIKTLLEQEIGSNKCNYLYKLPIRKLLPHRDLLLNNLLNSKNIDVYRLGLLFNHLKDTELKTLFESTLSPKEKMFILFMLNDQQFKEVIRQDFKIINFDLLSPEEFLAWLERLKQLDRKSQANLDNEFSQSLVRYFNKAEFSSAIREKYLEFINFLSQEKTQRLSELTEIEETNTELENRQDDPFFRLKEAARIIANNQHVLNSAHYCLTQLIENLEAEYLGEFTDDELLSLPKTHGLHKLPEDVKKALIDDLGKSLLDFVNQPNQANFTELENRMNKILPYVTEATQIKMNAVFKAILLITLLVVLVGAILVGEAYLGGILSTGLHAAGHAAPIAEVFKIGFALVNNFLSLSASAQASPLILKILPAILIGTWALVTEVLGSLLLGKQWAKEEVKNMPSNKYYGDFLDSAKELLNTTAKKEQENLKQNLTEDDLLEERSNIKTSSRYHSF